MKPPYDPQSYHSFCCGVASAAFVILLAVTVLLFAYGFIIPAIVGWALSLIALCFVLHHRN
jgi:hypothetical protein